MNIETNTESLIESNSIELPDYNIPTEAEAKQAIIKHLNNLYKQQGRLEQSKIQALSYLSDPEKVERIYDMVSMLHLEILKLEIDAQGRLETDIEQILTDLNLIDFWKATKHNHFTKSKQVFVEHKETHEQKSVVKSGSLSLRQLKKQKTPREHVLYVHSAKQLHDLKDKVVKLENKIDEQQLLNEIRFNSVELRLSSLENDKIVFLESKLSNEKQILAYRTKLLHPEKTNIELSVLLDVGRNTLTRWFKQVDEILLEFAS